MNMHEIERALRELRLSGIVNGWQEALFSGCEDAVPVFGL